MLAQRTGQQLTDESPLLVVAGPLERHREVACSTLLDTDAAAAVLVFAYQRRPRIVAEHVREHTDDETPLTILDLSDGDDHGGSAPDLGPNVVLEGEAVANLTRIGIHVVDAIERADDRTLHVCLGSLTTLVQYVDPETAFKFLQVTISRLEAADAVVHAHLDPDAVDEETTATLQPLFEGILRRQSREWMLED